jgi:predicted GNAT family N-acyltransferase
MITDGTFLSIEDLVSFEVKNSISPSILDRFQNEQQVLVDYLQTKAVSESTKNIGKTWLYLKNDHSKIYGFYTLSSASIERKDIKGRYPYPLISAALIGRLARDTSVKGSGVGETLMIHAFSKIIESSKNMAVNVIVTDAKNEAALNFYLKFGFKKLKSSVDRNYPYRVIMSVDTAKMALE